jgi:hypothetical protein
MARIMTHNCAFPVVHPENSEENILWYCPDCKWQYRLNKIVWRWFRYFPPKEAETR